MIGFRRDGHLTDLALELLMDGGEISGAKDHLADCSVCAARHAAAQAVSVPVLLPREVRPARTPLFRWAAVGAALAMAASLLLLFVGEDADDGIRVRGRAVSVQVFRDEGATSRRLRDGDRASAGDRLGFRIRSRTEGQVMIVSWDGQQAPSVCYPQRGDGWSVGVAGDARYVDVPEAVRLDDTPGFERFALMWCPERFRVEQASRYLVAGELPAGCLVDELELEKR